MLADLSNEPPPTPFQLFSQDIRNQKVNWSSRLSPLEISRKVAQAWFELTPAAKHIYYERAEVFHQRSFYSNVTSVSDMSSSGVVWSTGLSSRSRSNGSEESKSSQSKVDEQSSIESNGHRRPISRSHDDRGGRAGISPSRHSQQSTMPLHQ
jgi:hypothetical protein